METSLHHYLNVVEPGYAVLIDGKWGSGKSHYLKENLGRLTTKKQIYVSLFGMTTAQEIEDAIGATILTLPGGDLLKEGGPLLAELINRDSASGILGSVAASVGKWARKSLLKSIGPNHILILDDLERFDESNISIPLSAASKYAEQQGSSVIIVCDASRITDAMYHQHKEKVVRYTYEFKLSYDSIFDILKSNLSDKNGFKSFISDIGQEQIRPYIEKHDCSNIRTLSAALNTVELVYNEYRHEFQKNTNFSSTIVRETILYSSLINSSMIPHGKIEKLLKSPDAYWISFHLDREKPDPTEDDLALEKIIQSFPDEGPRHPSMWFLLKSGTINHEKLQKELRSWLPSNQLTPLEILLDFYSYRYAAEINDAIKHVLNQLVTKSLKFEKIELLIKCLLKLDRLSNSNSIPCTPIKLLEITVEFLREVKKDVSKWFDATSYFETTQLSAFAHIAEETPNREKIWAALSEVWDEVRKWRLSLEISEIEKMLEDPQISIWETIDKKFLHTPFLHEINYKLLISAISESDNHEFLRQAHIFFMRRSESHPNNAFLEKDVTETLKNDLYSLWKNSYPTILNEPRKWLLKSLENYSNRIHKMN